MSVLANGNIIDSGSIGFMTRKCSLFF